MEKKSYLCTVKRNMMQVYDDETREIQTVEAAAEQTA
jgi:hypothetical protein